MKRVGQHQAAFKAEYEAGESMASIAKRYSTTTKSVSKWLKAQGVTLRQRGLTPAQKEEIYARYQAGEKPYEMAQVTGYAYSTIRATLTRDYKVVLVDEERMKYAHLLDQIRADYEAGDSALVISNRYRISLQTATNYLYHRKVAVRDYEEASRKYTINDTYFDHLTPQKACQLGLIFAMVNRRKSKEDRLKTLDIYTYTTREHLLMAALEGVSSQQRHELTRYTFRKQQQTLFSRTTLYSRSLVAKLTELGLYETLPAIDDALMPMFWTGYLAAATTVNGGEYRIPASKYDDVFFNGLLQHLHTLIPTFSYRKEANTLVCRNTGQFITLAKHYPFLMDLVPARCDTRYAAETQRVWHSVIQRYFNDPEVIQAPVFQWQGIYLNTNHVLATWSNV